jgi:hypothetical protein
MTVVRHSRKTISSPLAYFPSSDVGVGSPPDHGMVSASQRATTCVPARRSRSPAADSWRPAEDREHGRGQTKKLGVQRVPVDPIRLASAWRASAADWLAAGTALHRVFRDRACEEAALAGGPLDAEVQAAIDRIAPGHDVRRIAVMPDVHLAADVCIGTVVATSGTLYPNAVGGDIGCGVAALAFDGEAARLDDERAAAAVLACLYRKIPLTRHDRQRAPGLSPELT